MSEGRHCSVCGIGFGLSKPALRYSSYLMDETCPDLVPVACNETCAAEMTNKIASGEIKPPVIRNTELYGTVLMKRGVGYFAP